MKVYVDGIMGLNFMVDFLLLLGTERITGFPPEWKRLTAAALLGAVYSGVCLVSDFHFLAKPVWRLACLGLMGSLAFGWNQSSLKRCCVFVFLSFALGGLAMAVGCADLWSLAAASAGLWFLGRIFFRAASGDREYVTLEIQNGERKVKLLALHDTGNTLCDPITGQQALVISASAAARLTGLTQRQLQSPLETVSDHVLPGLRLIPFRTVGQNGGMMLAMRFADVVVNGRRRSALVAFAPENFHGGAAYQALTGGGF